MRFLRKLWSRITGGESKSSDEVLEPICLDSADERPNTPQIDRCCDGSLEVSAFNAPCPVIDADGDGNNKPKGD